MNVKNIIRNILNKNRLYSFKQFKKALLIYIKNYINSDNLNIYIKKTYNNICSFNYNKNEITLSNKLIKDIYNGKIVKLQTIFHEIAHYQINEQIKNNQINEYLYNIIVEQEFRKYENEFECDNFYIENYHVCTMENYADYLSIENTIQFLNSLNIELNEDEINYLKQIYSNSEFNLNIELRSFYNCHFMKKKIMTINEMYNYLNEHNVNFDNYPQLNSKQITKKIQI